MKALLESKETSLGAVEASRQERVDLTSKLSELTTLLDASLERRAESGAAFDRFQFEKTLEQRAFLLDIRANAGQIDRDLVDGFYHESQQMLEELAQLHQWTIPDLASVDGHDVTVDEHDNESHIDEAHAEHGGDQDEANAGDGHNEDENGYDDELEACKASLDDILLELESRELALEEAVAVDDFEAADEIQGTIEKLERQRDHLLMMRKTHVNGDDEAEVVVSPQECGNGADETVDDSVKGVGDSVDDGDGNGDADDDDGVSPVENVDFGDGHNVDQTVSDEISNDASLGAVAAGTDADGDGDGDGDGDAGDEQRTERMENSAEESRQGLSALAHDGTDNGSEGVDRDEADEASVEAAKDEEPSPDRTIATSAT